MTYRSDVDALAARKAALDAEVEARTKERDEAARMLAELHATAKLPVLPNIRIASPCTADWNAMTGDDRVRHCAQCNKDVFNLSAMTRVEAETLIVEKNHDLCARYYQRKDGTILLSDCEVGRAQQRRLRLVGAGLLVTITAGATVGAALTHEHSSFQTQDSLGVFPDVPQEPEYTALAGDIGGPPTSTGVAECDAYRDSIYELSDCEGLPAQARTAILDAYRQAEHAWVQIPDSGRAALADACHAATKSIRDTMQTVCHQPPGIAPPSPTGIYECDQYLEQMYELASCDGMPAVTRKALLDAYAQNETTFAQVPVEGRAALADSCKETTVRLRQSYAPICHPGLAPTVDGDR